MALNHDASLLAVAFGRKIALLSNWFSGGLSLLGICITYILPTSSLSL
jgi:hypothetical protein